MKSGIDIFLELATGEHKDVTRMLVDKRKVYAK